MIERFGLFLEISGKQEFDLFQRHISFVIGISFILLASYLAIYSIWQHKRILKSIKPDEIPYGYSLNTGMATNGIVGILGIVLSIYLFRGFL